MVDPTPLENLRFMFQVLDELNLTKIFFVTIAFSVFLFIFNVIFHDPNTVSGEQAMKMQIMAIGSTVHIDLSDDDGHDYEVEEWQPEPTASPSQLFTACPKCGAPRKSHTCDYCSQTTL